MLTLSSVPALHIKAAAVSVSGLGDWRIVLSVDGGMAVSAVGDWRVTTLTTVQHVFNKQLRIKKRDHSS
ncbi:unnamed protein product [Macrosiphum euphorbiae]|uniref:Uncharacterized protein n=1 Tax=Macrosiphum euphorbiae TaxID=13131 RepID=A0AAV0XR21_9HEMI|nr:unnamed protein product [Macrosiphum euphorbiae]